MGTGSRGRSAIPDVPRILDKLNPLPRRQLVLSYRAGRGGYEAMVPPTHAIALVTVLPANQLEVF